MTILLESPPGISRSGDTMAGALTLNAGATFQTDGVAIRDLDSLIAVKPEAGKAGITIELPASTYGDTPYTDGEFPFVLLEEGSNNAKDSTGAGSALYRLDHLGGTGQNGGAHFAIGVRKATGGTVAVWIDPAEDLIPLVIHNPTVGESGTWVSNYISVVDTRASNAVRFAVNAAGQTLVDPGVVGAPSVSFAGDEDTGVYRLAANWIGFAAGGIAVFSIAAGSLFMGDGINFQTGTTTGTKFGTTTSQKIGFWAKGPVVQPAGVADASGGAVIDSQARAAISAVIANLEAIGLQAVV